MSSGPTATPGILSAAAPSQGSASLPGSALVIVSLSMERDMWQGVPQAPTATKCLLDLTTGALVLHLPLPHFPNAWSLQGHNLLS